MKKLAQKLFVQATVIALPLVASAQDVTEEVVVTARQRAEVITDVPATIKAFSEAEIQRAGIERAEDFIALTPGVSMVDSAEVGDTQVNIRGINGARDGEANFAFIVDGILYTNPSAFNREFANLQQIEILKGPQGAQYGRSASAGAVIVTTKKPSNEFTGDLKVSGGSQETYFVSAAASGALIRDQLYGGFHVDYRDSDGFYKNIFQDNDKIVDDFENYNVNGRLVWEPTEDLSFDLRGHYGEVDAASISFNAAFQFGEAGPAGSPIFEDVNSHNFIFEPNVDPSNDQESWDISLKMDWDLGWGSVTAWGLYSDIEQQFLADGTSGAFGFFAGPPASTAAATPECLADFGPGGVATTRSIAAPQFYGAIPQPAPLTFPVLNGSFLGPYTPTTCDGYQFQVRNQEDYSFELRLSSPDDQRLRWQVGGYYLDLERQVGVAQLRDDGRGSLPKSLINPLTETLVNDQFDTRVYAIFGNFQYDLTETVEVSVALRYDNEKREVSSLVPTPAQQRSNFVDYTIPSQFFPIGAPGCDDAMIGSPLNPAFIDFTNSTFGTAGGCRFLSSIPDREETFDEVQPKISVRWDASDDLTVFGSWGRGFKSGGFNNQGSQATIDLYFNDPALGANPFGPSYGPAGLSISDQFEKETSDAFEIGFKSTIAGGRVQLEGALFHTLVDDMQFFNFFVGPFGLLRVVSNIDESTITGMEFAGRINLTDQLDVFGAFAYTDSEIDKNTNRPQTAGNEVPYTPQYTLNVGGEFIEPNVFMNADLLIRFDYNVIGPTWFATVQEGDLTPNLFTGFGFGRSDQTLAERDSYGLVNARIGLQTDTWGLHMFARNLLSEDYLEEVIPAPEFGGAFIHPGNRRSWGLEASYSF